MRRVIWIGLSVLFGGFLLIQLIPYGRDHLNPPVTAEPAWDSPETRALAVAACFDCHMIPPHTKWPGGRATVWGCVESMDGSATFVVGGCRSSGLRV